MFMCLLLSGLLDPPHYCLLNQYSRNDLCKNTRCSKYHKSSVAFSFSSCSQSAACPCCPHTHTYTHKHIYTHTHTLTAGHVGGEQSEGHSTSTLLLPVGSAQHHMCNINVWGVNRVKTLKMGYFICSSQKMSKGQESKVEIITNHIIFSFGKHWKWVPQTWTPHKG